ncbi:MAG TPA: dienelactone hydrolase family protein, partial [Chitinophagaceae bacterium]|nr:dienelactone hydrolase family protein [Chitinophagaceae bacterium]
MINHDFVSLTCADGSLLDAYVAFPEPGGDAPGLILLQEAFGVNPHIRDVADRLCREGFAVIAPDLFHRTARRLEIPYTDFASAAPHYQAITLQGLEWDLIACHDWLAAQPGVIPDRIGSIGFCLGGRVAYLANTILPLCAGVSFYGGGLDQLADRAPSQHGAHLFFWGGLDKHIPAEKVNTILSAVREAGKEYSSVV